MTKIQFTMEIPDCTKCPKVNSSRTINAGFAFDYHCSLMGNRKIMGYVEYKNDIEPIPDWCPIRVEG